MKDMGDVIELKKDKIFSLKAAHDLLPVVRRVTQEAVDQVEKLKDHFLILKK